MLKQCRKAILISLIILITGCQSASSDKKTIKLVGCDTVLINKQYFETSIDLYEIDSVFYNYLDTIVEFEKQCKNFDECLTGFVVISYIDHDGLDFLSIETIPNIYTYDYSECKGIFIYKNFHFLLSYTNLSILKKKNTSYKQKYINVDTPLSGYDDRWSTWTFQLNGNKYILKSHFKCEADDSKVD